MWVNQINLFTVYSQLWLYSKLLETENTVQIILLITCHHSEYFIWIPSIMEQTSSQLSDSPFTFRNNTSTNKGSTICPLASLNFALGSISQVFSGVIEVSRLNPHVQDNKILCILLKNGWTCLFLGGYCLSVVNGEAAGLKVGDVNPLINPAFGNGVT